MPTDPSIILQAQSPQLDIGAIFKQAYQLKEMKQQQESRNALRGLFSNPANLDPKTGTPTSNALIQYSRVDPKGAMELREQAASIEDRNALKDERRVKAMDDREDHLQEVRLTALTTYKDALARGLPKEAAMAAGQTELATGIGEMKKSGRWSEEEQSSFQTDFDPSRIQARYDASKEGRTAKHQATVEEETRKRDAEAVRRDDLIEGSREANLGERSRHDRVEETQGGERIVMAKDKAGGGKPNLSDEAVNLLADQYLSGDKSVFQNLGRGAQGAADIAALRNKVADKMIAQGKGGAEVATTLAEYAGLTAGERALGTRTANVGMAVNEASQFAELSRTAYKKLPRGQFLPFNKLEQFAEKQTSSPEQASAYAADNSFINAYARAVNPSGVPTESDKKHARDMLNTAQSTEAHDAVLDQLQKEMAAAIKSPEHVRQELSAGRGGTPSAGSPPVSLLKENTITHFKNGQNWTIRGGRAVQVQ